MCENVDRWRESLQRIDDHRSTPMGFRIFQINDYTVIHESLENVKVPFPILGFKRNLKTSAHSS